LANIILLTTSELKHILNFDEHGRDEVAALLAKSKTPLVSSLDRPTII
jgi:hypothetical protein